MKNLSVLALLCCFVFLYSSCSKDDANMLESNDSNELIDVRVNPGECNACAGINVSFTEVGEVEGCCIYEVSIEDVPECIGAGSRHFLFLNGVYETPLTTGYNSHQVQACGSEEVLVEVIGFNFAENQWNEVCFSQVISCNCDCDQADLNVELLEAGSDACCDYNVSVNLNQSNTNPSICNFALSINGEVYAIEDEGFETQLSTCEGENISLALYQGENLCQEEEVICELPDFCDLFVYEDPLIEDNQCCYEFTTICDATFIVTYYDEVTNQVIDIIQVTSDVNGLLTFCVPVGQIMMITLSDINGNCDITPEEIEFIYSIWSQFCYFTC